MINFAFCKLSVDCRKELFYLILNDMKKLFVIVIFTICFGNLFSQEKWELDLVDRAPRYLYIIDVLNGPSCYKDYIKDGEEENAGYKFRVIKTFSDVYEYIFIDNQTLDVEGGISKQNWVREIDLKEIYDSYEDLMAISAPIEFIKWIDCDSFSIMISDKKFIIKIISAQKINVVRC